MSRYIVSPHEQGSQEWLNSRIGMITGSVVDAVFAKVKTGEAATRANLRMDKVLEIILQKPSEPSFSATDAMAWGTEQEPYARMAYERKTGLDVDQLGFIHLADGTRAGCSLDGKLVDGTRKGFVEFKCPKSKNHYAYLMAGIMPSEYLAQVTHNFWITGYDFCDFMSFDPRMPEELQQFHIRVERNEAAVQAHAAGVLQFLMEVDADVKKMRALIEQRRMESQA